MRQVFYCLANHSDDRDLSAHREAHLSAAMREGLSMDGVVQQIEHWRMLEAASDKPMEWKERFDENADALLNDLRRRSAVISCSRGVLEMSKVRDKRDIVNDELHDRPTADKILNALHQGGWQIIRRYDVGDLLIRASLSSAWDRIDGRRWAGATRSEMIEVVLTAIEQADSS